VDGKLFLKARKNLCWTERRPMKLKRTTHFECSNKE
jgi:hypothetical protein